MKTRSVLSSQVDSLSTNLTGGGSVSPRSDNKTRRGPSPPKWSHTEEEPGPPLNANVTDLVEASTHPFKRYATKNTAAFFFPLAGSSRDREFCLPGSAS